MDTQSITARPTIVKDTKPDRFWVKCTMRKCFFIDEVSSAKSADTKARAHLAAHPAHVVEIHTVNTEVLYGKES